MVNPFGVTCTCSQQKNASNRALSMFRFIWLAVLCYNY